MTGAGIDTDRDCIHYGAGALSSRLFPGRWRGLCHQWADAEHLTTEQDKTTCDRCRARFIDMDQIDWWQIHDLNWDM